jgi:hypothetical protein
MSRLIMFDPEQYSDLETAMESGASYQAVLNNLDLSDKGQVENVLTIVEATADMLSHKHRVEAFICQGNRVFNIREVIHGLT